MTLPDKDTLDIVGGVKVNETAVEDPEREEDAEHRNIYVADTTMMTRTAPRCVAEITLADAMGEVLLEEHEAMWGAGVSDAPSVERVGTGTFVLTWPETVQDPLGEAHELNLRRAAVSVQGPDPFLHTEDVVAPNQVRIRMFDVTGAPDDAAGTTVTVWGYY